MANIEIPQRFTLNTFEETPERAFLGIPDRRFLERVIDYLEKTSPDGVLRDTVEVWQELGRQLVLPNTREVHLAMAGAYRLAQEIHAAHVDEINQPEAEDYQRSLFEDNDVPY